MATAPKRPERPPQIDPAYTPPIAFAPVDVPGVPTDLIHLKDAAKIVGTTRQTVLRWVLKGQLVGYKIGCRFRVSKQDLLDQIQPYTATDANNRKIADNASRPRSRREQEAHDAEIDQRLRAAGIRR